MDGRLRIGELGDRVGLSTATLRYYESLGLLGEPERSPSGYRLYGTDDEERLRFIIRAKALDLSLDEIRSLLELWHRGTCTETRSTLRHLVAHKIREARSRAQEAAAFADQLTHVYARLGEDVGLEVPAPHDGTSAQQCGCIPDLPPAEALDLDAELALIDQSVCGCGARLDEVAGAPQACACGCCAPAGSGTSEPNPIPVLLRTSTGEEVRTP